MQKYFLVLVTCIVTVFSTCPLAETFTAHCRDYPPELSFDGSKCVGILPDLVTDIVTELGHKIFWIKAPWIRSIKDSKNGNVDLLIRHSMTLERKLFLEAIPYAYYIRNLSFYKSPTFKLDIKSYEDLKKVNVGAIRGNFYSPTFLTLDSKELTLVGTTEQLLGMLELGRIDVAVTSASHNIELFESRFEKASFVDTFVNPMYISIPKKSVAIRFYKDIATIMQEYRASGKLDQYFERYGLPVPKQVFD